MDDMLTRLQSAIALLSLAAGGLDTEERDGMLVAVDVADGIITELRKAHTAMAEACGAVTKEENLRWKAERAAAAAGGTVTFASQATAYDRATAGTGEAHP